MSKSVYMQLSDIEAEISKASAVLCGAQTCVDSNFCEGNWGDFQALARYHGGNLQLLLSVVGSMLMHAESQISELEEMLHGESGKKEAVHE